MKNKPLMILILILAPIALVFGVYKTFFADSSGVALPNTLQFVNVETGQLLSYKRGSFPSVPIRDNTTKRYSIYPVARNEQGQWVVDERHRAGIGDLAKSATLKVDLQTFVVQTK